MKPMVLGCAEEAESACCVLHPRASSIWRDRAELLRSSKCVTVPPGADAWAPNSVNPRNFICKDRARRIPLVLARCVTTGAVICIPG